MLSRCSRSLRASAFPPLTRALATSAPRLTATPDWQELIGGRAGVEKKKAAYQQKYADALKAKAEREGLTQEQLVEKAKAAEVEARAVERRLLGLKDMPEEKAASGVEDNVENPTPGVEKGVEGEVVRPPPSSQAAQFTKKSSDSPVKTLNSILDLSKASTLTPSAIATLWTQYHQAKGFLSAAIPTDVYNTIIAAGKKYPMFVLPLARDAPDAVEGEQGAVEMHLLQWAFLPQPPGAVQPVPSPSTVLFTPLGEYQVRQSYAQPYLILTHYTDLSLSHGFVLMRGEISDNVALTPTDAQVLAVRMQLFYNHSGKGGKQEEVRTELLKNFHEKPEEFDLDRLVKTAWEL